MNDGFAVRAWRHSPLVRLLLGLLIALLWAVTPTASLSAERSDGAPALILNKAWWIDPQGKSDLAQVIAQAEWTEYTGSKSFGFGNEPVWVRVRVRGTQAEDPQPVVLRINPAFTDELTVYDPASDLTLRAGRAIAPNHESLSTITFAFRLPAHMADRDIYVKAVSISSRNLQIEAMPYAQAERTSRLHEWILGAAVAISFVFAAWAGLQWLFSRDSVMGAFAIKQIVATVQSFVFLGFARQVLGPWLPAGTLVWAGSFILALLCASSAWFMATLVKPYQPWLPLLRTLQTTAVFYALAPLLWLAGFKQEMLIIVNASVPVVLLLLAATTLSAWRADSKQPLPLSFLLAYVLLYGVLHTISILMTLGFVPGANNILLGNVTTSILDGIIMFMILQFRHRAIQKMQRETELDLIRNRALATAERAQREDQERLFAMLAHELKTPLSTLRLSIASGPIGREAMDRTIADLSKIIDRCVQSGQLAHRSLAPDPLRTDARALTLDCIRSCREPDRIRLTAPAGLVPVVTDEQILNVVISNLLDNACKYSAPQSPIEVQLEPREQDGVAGLLWKVSNSIGPAGVPDRDRLFEKYYRSPNARRQSGSGLGLYLVHGLLKLLKGSIRHEAPQGSVVFIAWIPEQAS